MFIITDYFREYSGDRQMLGISIGCKVAFYSIVDYFQ